MKRVVRRGTVLALALWVGSCAGAGTSSPFAGTCLEALFQCFQAQGAGTCSFDSGTSLATLTFASGARVESGAGGTMANRCFSPDNTFCFTVTTINDTTRSYAGQGVTVTVTNQGSQLLLSCPGGNQTVAVPASNPAEEDLRRCAPSP